MDKISQRCKCIPRYLFGCTQVFTYIRSHSLIFLPRCIWWPVQITHERRSTPNIPIPWNYFLQDNITSIFHICSTHPHIRSNWIENIIFAERHKMFFRSCLSQEVHPISPLLEIIRIISQELFIQTILHTSCACIFFRRARCPSESLPFPAGQLGRWSIWKPCFSTHRPKYQLWTFNNKDIFQLKLYQLENN